MDRFAIQKFRGCLLDVQVIRRGWNQQGDIYLWWTKSTLIFIKLQKS